VPLRDELAFLHDYLDIQRIRFQGMLEVTDDVAPEALDALVPNLLLQPLVENAVQHGVSRLETGTGRIVLRAWRDGERLVLHVRDNGPGLDGWGPGGDGRAGGVGLANTQGRLDALYGDAARLLLRPAEGGGLVAEVALPYHTAADLRTAERAHA
jgi:sensor histidine kinase YesM